MTVHSLTTPGSHWLWLAMAQGRGIFVPVLTNYAPCHEDVWDSGYIDLHFLDFVISWRKVIGLRTGRLSPQGRSLRNSLDMELGGSQSLSGWRGEEKILQPYWDSNSDPSIVQPVTSCYTGSNYGSSQNQSQSNSRTTVSLPVCLGVRHPSRA
jgi:hypothetical protein